MDDGKRSTMQYAKVEGPARTLRALPYRTRDSGRTQRRPGARINDSAAVEAPAAGQHAHGQVQNRAVLRVAPERQNAPRLRNRPAVRRGAGRQGGR